MRNIRLVISAFILSGLMYGCAENKQPAEKAKDATSQVAESVGEKPAVKEAPTEAAETKEKTVEKKEAAPAAVPEEKTKPASTQAPVLPVSVKETVASVKEAVKAPVASVKEALKEPVATVKDTAAGAAIFKSKCSLCHGADGKGSTMAPAFKGNNWIKSASNADVAEVIKNGRKGTAKKYPNFFSDMPASKTLPESDVNALVDYLKSVN